MKIIAFLVLALILAGCSTFGDIRQSEPTKSLFIENPNTKEIAMCAAFKMKDNFPSSTIIERAGDFFLSITSIGAAGVWPVAEITFKPQYNGTIIELRRYPWMASWQESKIWDPIGKCVSPQNNPGK